jgi:hypothetical protein
MDEIPAIAGFLNLSEHDFIQEYTVLRPSRSGLALKPTPGGECLFLKDRDCMLQTVKPRQCKGFPNEWNFPGWREVCEAIEVEE